jgi:chaperonin cofactor prefoldin
MNPLIEAQIDRITSQIEELAKALEENERDLATERTEKEELRQGQWDARRESATLQRVEKQYDELRDEHAKLICERKTLKEGLSKIIAFVKLVDGALRP